MSPLTERPNSLLRSPVAWLRSGRGRLATIDTARAAPPPSPLAPIDLQDPAQVAGVMQIAARIGDILLSSGTGNRDASAQIHAVTTAYGLHYCHVAITMNTITIATSIGTTTKTPVDVFRVSRQMTTDFSKLAEVDRLIRSIQSGATPPALAESILDELEARPKDYGFKTAMWGWALLGGSATVLLGGNLAVAAITFVTSLFIMVTAELLSRRGLPPFFQQMVGGFIATVPAAVLYQLVNTLGFSFRPSQIIASCIIVLVSGLSLVQSLQDGMTGAAVTGSARFFDTLLMTVGIVAGVAIGIRTSTFLGISLPPFEVSNPPNFASGVIRTIASAFVCAGFAIGSFAERAAVRVSAISGIVGAAVVYLVLIPMGIGEVAASGVSAVVIGFAGGLLSRRFLIPPLITGLSGVTPLLPGLLLYRAMYALLNSQMVVGFTNLFLALSIGGALAAGLVFGEWSARRVRRPQVFRPYDAFRRAGRFSFQKRPRPRRS